MTTRKAKREGADPSPKTGKSVEQALSLAKGEDLKSMIKEAVREAMEGVIGKLDHFNKRLIEVEKTTTTLSKMAIGTEESAQKASSEVKVVKRDTKTLENQIIGLQMENSKTIIRIQNFAEEEGENIKEKLADFLAPLAEKTPRDLKSELVVTYRAATRYVVTHSLPREVFARLSSMETRNVILKNASGAALTFKGQEVKIMKEVPFLARKRRFKYKKLTTILQKKSIRYRWLVPEGLCFQFEGQFIKITSESQLCDFLSTHKNDPDFQKTAEEDADVGAEGAAGGALKKKPRGGVGKSGLK